jgi:hypothetical protein
LGREEIVLRLAQILNEGIDGEIADSKTSVPPSCCRLVFAGPAGVGVNLHDEAAFQARHIRIGEEAVDALVGGDVCDKVIDDRDDRLLSSKSVPSPSPASWTGKMAPLCREFSVSRKTDYKILRRYNDSGKNQ